MKKEQRMVYMLDSCYEHGDSETLGVYDSPRAMVAGLAEVIYRHHVAARDAKPEEIAKTVALAVFDFVSLFGFKSDRSECLDGDTVFGCCKRKIQSLDDEKEGDNA